MSAHSSTPESKAKIEGLVYENRQHCIGSTMLIQSAHDYLMVGPTGKKNAKDESYETKDNKFTDSKSNRNRKRKKVTFRKDSELVSIREISPRPNRSDSSDNCCDSSSSDSESSDSESSSSEGESSDDDDDDSNFINKVSKLVLRHTRDKPAKTADGVIPTRPIPPRPPRLRRPRASRPPATKKPSEKLTSPSSPLPSKGDVSKPNKPATLSTTTRKYGRSLILRRPQSCTEPRDRLKQRPPSPVLTRVSSARASLSMSSGSRPTQDETIIRRRIVSASSAMMRVAPQNDRYASLDSNNNTNSGQERTKFYAWQVANGAPLVTTPGIAPMYSEQVTLTRL